MQHRSVMPDHPAPVAHPDDTVTTRDLNARLDWLETADGPIVALSTLYPDGFTVPLHRHSRSQLLHALSGVVMISTALGRWMVPPDHAVWIPAGIDHSVEMFGDVGMYSVYIKPGAVAGLPPSLRVVAMSPLMNALVVEAVSLPTVYEPASRADHLMNLVMHEVPQLVEVPLALPFPTDPRLAALCRAYVLAPSPHLTIDDFARRAGMSRRSFTRAFQRETGLGLMRWRQQACLFAALPRLSHGESVTSVALDLGYESVPAFITMFRRTIGVSPRRYAKGGL
ncbi:AraC family transcriptional regulator [Pararhizobium haloflavum]|uniref:AraC family transcriptional regulator n=1 Tax=Pararhizobium haloflavum TaxID=2037914 RepID=UPI001FE03E59|nr:helix-turn-helix transcriptional regulator [Pararhizobium haloflavum]